MRIAALETECAALEEALASLREQREKALTAAATGDVTARETLAQLAVKLAAKEASLRNIRDMLAAARRGLEEAEAREEAERREAKRREIEALSQERLAAAQAVDAALEELAAAIRRYRGVCDAQVRLAPEAGMGRRPFEFNEYVLSEAASTHLYRLLPELRHVSWKERGSLVEKDAVTRTLVEGGDAA